MNYFAVCSCEDGHFVSDKVPFWHQLKKYSKQKLALAIENSTNMCICLLNFYSFQTPCTKNPCQNGATCSPNYSRDEYKCVCLPGFTGQHCETGRY